ncbi:hypothetical protein WOLCODRAFT_27465 [Wolfiporia cocos MD-104 SS10]|uniref:Uncharacterized protein n=1 Tax=Wolfiporia cocos (strain MD-104) TaxID=742152 RepID=A0A2H3IXU6_WOLCO|nr:hypothetical protein WOLCODRAFT_27465 [Wolfiporia cocos MD-104 SS10]
MWQRYAQHASAFSHCQSQAMQDYLLTNAEAGIIRTPRGYNKQTADLLILDRTEVML